MEEIFARDGRDGDAAFLEPEAAVLMAVHAGGILALGAQPTRLAGALQRRAGAQHSVEVNGLTHTLVGRVCGTIRRAAEGHPRSAEHTPELQSRRQLVSRLLPGKKKRRSGAPTT